VSSHKSKRKHYQHKSAHEGQKRQDESQKKSEVVYMGEGNPPPHSIQSQDANGDTQDSREKKKFALEIATVVLLFLYTSIALWQGCLVRNQFSKDQRPYVLARPDSPVLNRDYQSRPGTPPIAWNVYLINYGKSPAVNVYSCYHFSASDNAALLRKSVSENVPESGCSAPDSQSEIGGIIPPGPKENGVFKTISPHRAFSPEELSVIENSDDLIAISGFIRYEDFAGNTYRTTFCGMRYASGAVHDCKPNYNRMK
jgi:hypothetical protein